MWNTDKGYAMDLTAALKSAEGLRPPGQDDPDELWKSLKAKDAIILRYESVAATRCLLANRGSAPFKQRNADKLKVMDDLFD